MHNNYTSKHAEPPKFPAYYMAYVPDSHSCTINAINPSSPSTKKESEITLEGGVKNNALVQAPNMYSLTYGAIFPLKCQSERKHAGNKSIPTLPPHLHRMHSSTWRRQRGPSTSKNPYC